MRKINVAGNPKKTCSKCKEPLGNRWPNYRYCRKCHAEYMRKTRPNHSQLSPEARKKANTRAYTKEYIKRGYIKKQPCLVCGNKNSEAHHENYDKPLEIIWLCRAHHLELHNKKHNATKS